MYSYTFTCLFFQANSGSERKFLSSSSLAPVSEMETKKLAKKYYFLFLTEKPGVSNFDFVVLVFFLFQN